MKKFLLILGMLLMTCGLFAQIVIDPNPDGTLNFAWDAPANVLDGTISALEVTYEFYMTTEATANLDRENDAAFTLVAVVPATQLLNVDVTVLGENKLVFGVRAIRTIVGVGIFYTATHWSDLEGSPAPFTVWYFIRPGKATSLRVQ